MQKQMIDDMTNLLYRYEGIGKYDSGSWNALANDMAKIIDKYGENELTSNFLVGIFEYLNSSAK